MRSDNDLIVIGDACAGVWSYGDWWHLCRWMVLLLCGIYMNRQLLMSCTPIVKEMAFISDSRHTTQVVHYMAVPLCIGRPSPCLL